VTVTDTSRIVSLNGDFTEIIYALGLQESLVAVDTSATFPPEALELPKVGYQRSLSSEGILAMEPTLVIGGISAGPPEALDQIREAGVTVVILETEPTIAGAAKKIRDIAAALGVADRGEEIAASMEADVEEAKALAAKAAGDRPTAIFVYIRGLDTLLIAGNGDLSADMFDAAGAVSGGVEAGFNGFVPMTAEALVTAAPDFIVAFESGLESVGGVDGLLEVPGIAETPAGQSRSVVAFDGLFFSGGGPRTGEALMQLVLALHPELQPE
jgi:iron complex transport system substrate-binding protein